MFKITNTHNILQILHSHLLSYSTPYNLNYIWSIGAMAGIILVLQVVTGTSLAMHYTASEFGAFPSVQESSKEIWYGWYLRSLHANGASFYFILLYAHIMKALYYGSFNAPRAFVWWFGLIIFILSMACAFLGYILPWGQMSFWGATVITNLFTVIPVIGDQFLNWLWGDYGVAEPLLQRFFALHFFIPFVLIGMVYMHLLMLHTNGSNNPIGFNLTSMINFFPGFGVKDLFAFLLTFFFLTVTLAIWPEYMGHPDNAIRADSLVTPNHIVPEWYFLPFYAILRSIPSKVGGVIAMGFSLIILVFLPFFSTTTPNARAASFRPLFSFALIIFYIDMIMLGFIGQSYAQTPFVAWGFFCTVYYFVFFFYIIPKFVDLERNLGLFKNT